MSPLPKHDVLGVGVCPMDYAQTCRVVLEAAAQRRPLTVTALAVHGVMTGALDPEQRQRLNALDMVLPDGQPVRWALNLLFGTGLSDRVYGPNLMLRVCEQAAALGLAVGFYGNKPEVLAQLRSHLLTRIPDLRVAAMMPSRFGRVDAGEQADLARRIGESGTDVLFVGLGCPRQEVWLFENRGLLNMPMIAVGAAFDFHAQRLVQAPGWMQARGLEWLFRLWQEPRRLWRRYVLLNPAFVGLLLLQALRLHRFGGAAPGDVAYQGYA